MMKVQIDSQGAAEYSPKSRAVAYGTTTRLLRLALASLRGPTHEGTDRSDTGQQDTSGSNASSDADNAW